MALTAAQLNTIYNNVLFRNVDQGGIQFFANRTDISDAQVRQQIELSSEASSFVSPIVRLYQEVLGRVPDKGGLQFFSTQLRGGASLSSVAQQLVSSSEFNAKTTATSGVVDATDLSNTTQLVTDAFASILGRQPASSEFAFFQGMSPAMILAGVAGSSEAAATNAATVVTYLDSVALGTPNSGSLNNQTGSGGTGSQTGNITATLTLNADNIGGTGKGGDLFSAPLVFNAANGAQLQTLQTGDVISDTGGSATAPNVLNAQLNSGGLTNGVSISGVQTLNLTSFASGSGIGATGVTGVTTINNLNSTGSLTIGAAGNGLSTAPTTVGLTNTVGGAAGATTIFVATSALTGSSDALTINASGVGSLATAGRLTVAPDTAVTNGFETVTINATGTNYLGLSAGVAQTSTKTVTITGAGALDLESLVGANGFTKVTSIDASANTGGVTVGGNTFAGAGGLTGFLNGNTALTSFKGGSGNDLVDLTAFASLNGVTADGGTGTDTAIVQNAVATSTTPVANLTNFEILGVAGLNGTIDASKLSGIVDVKLYSATAGAVVINNGTSTFTLEEQNFSNANTFAVTATGTGTTDTLNIKLGAATADGAPANLGDTAGAHTVTGYETINITSQGAANTLAGITATASAGGTETLNISGSQTLAINGATALNGNGTSIVITNTAATTFNGTVSASKIDASASGGLLMNNGATTVATTNNDILTNGTTGDVITGSTTKANVIVGSLGNDVLTGGTAGDTFTTFGGGDTINLGTAGKTDSIFLSHGAGSIVAAGDVAQQGYFGIAPGGAAAVPTVSTSADQSTVSNFTVGAATVSGADILKIEVGAFAVGQAGGAGQTSAGLTTGNGNTVATGGDVAVTINAVNAGATLSGTANFIELTGATFQNAAAVATALKAGYNLNFAGTGVAAGTNAHILFGYQDSAGNAHIADIDFQNTSGAAVTSTTGIATIVAQDLVQLTGVSLSSVNANNIHLV